VAAGEPLRQPIQKNCECQLIDELIAQIIHDLGEQEHEPKSHRVTTVSYQVAALAWPRNP
jgi:hypothetical protein